MATILAQRQERRDTAADAREAWEHSSRARDVETDIAERMRPEVGFINISFDYNWQNGRLRQQEADFREVLQNGYEQAKLLAEDDPDWAIEARRRRAELDELAQVEALARGDLPENSRLLTVSAVPEETLAGRDVLTYKAKCPVALVRIWEKTPAGVRGRTISLDGSSPMALAMGVHELAGLDAAREFRSQSSEESIARPIVFVSESRRPDQDFIVAYDDIYSSIIGHKTRQGKVADQAKDGALNQLLRNPRYRDKVNDAKQKIFDLDQRRLPREQREAAYETIIYNATAAVMYLVQHKETSEDAVSLESAGDAARAEGRSFDPGCPTGSASPTGQQSIDAQMGRQPATISKEEKFYVKTCPGCGAKNFWATKSGGVIRGACGCVKDICKPDFDKIGRGPKEKKSLKVAAVALKNFAEKLLPKVNFTYRQRLGLGEKVVEILEDRAWRRASSHELRQVKAQNGSKTG